MLTRGRHANHAWIQITGDGDPPRPHPTRELLQPATATELLETILARDDAPASATTLLAQADHPDRLLGAASRLLPRRHQLRRRTPPRHHTSRTHRHRRRPNAPGSPTPTPGPPCAAHLILIAANGHNPATVLNRSRRARRARRRPRPRRRHRPTASTSPKPPAAPGTTPLAPRHPHRTPRRPLLEDLPVRPVRSCR